jgi:hypothetical protein
MNALKEYISPSGQLKVRASEAEGILESSYGDLKSVSTEEYVLYMKKCGEIIHQHDLNKVFLDLTHMKNFGLSLRAAGVNNINELMISKARYFILALVKSQNGFDNIATQTALNLAKPLSKKFLDGKMFSTHEAARKWLTDFPVPAK